MTEARGRFAGGRATLAGRISQVVLAIAGTFLVALLLALGASRWLPAGAGAVNHLVLPVVVFPLIWTALILTLFVARRRGRVWAALGVLGVGHALGLWLSVT
jgi:hypothetical protein